MKLNRKYSKNEYLNYDLLSGDRDIEVKFRKVTIAKIRKPQTCFGIYGDDSHELEVGTIVQRDSCMIDGVFGVAHTCLDCLDKALDE